MRISDWSSDVCSSDLDLLVLHRQDLRQQLDHGHLGAEGAEEGSELDADGAGADDQQRLRHGLRHHGLEVGPDKLLIRLDTRQGARPRSEEHTSELQSLMRISYAVFCLKKKNHNHPYSNSTHDSYST